MKVSVIGLGYVGSVTAAGLAAMGHDVLGIDVDEEKVAAYTKGRVAIYEPGLTNLVKDALKQQKLRFLHTTSVDEPLGGVIVIATGTPTSETGAADLNQVRSALQWVKEKQSAGVIVMKSTVPPGTGVRLSEGLLRDTGYQYVANPEFLREGQALSDWFNPDRIVVGAAQDSTMSVIKELYPGIDAPYVLTDVTSAEMIKYASNAFLATKISFINEIAALCDKLGATIDDVSHGIALDPRIGPSFLRPGVGYGGSCFPKDVRALDFLALANDHNFEVLRSVITVNNRQRLLPLYTLREHFGTLSQVKVAVLGLSFKPHTDDVREAPAIDLIRYLVEEGAQVTTHDPQGLDNAQRVLPSQVSLMENLMDCVAGAQALVLMTEWPEIIDADWAEIARVTRSPRFLFDGRNALNAGQMLDLGFLYSGVGRGAIPAASKNRSEITLPPIG